MIEFERASSFAMGDYVRVLMVSESLPEKGWFKKFRKQRTTHYKGWILIGPGAEHQYFESEIQSGKEKFSDISLERLKAKIIAYWEPNVEPSVVVSV